MVSALVLPVTVILLLSVRRLLAGWVISRSKAPAVGATVGIFSPVSSGEREGVGVGEVFSLVCRARLARHKPKVIISPKMKPIIIAVRISFFIKKFEADFLIFPKYSEKFIPCQGSLVLLQ